MFEFYYFIIGELHSIFSSAKKNKWIESSGQEPNPLVVGKGDNQPSMESDNIQR